MGDNPWTFVLILVFSIFALPYAGVSIYYAIKESRDIHNDR